MDLESKQRGVNPQPLVPKPTQVLLPLRNLDEAELLLPLAEMIVQARQGQLSILLIVTVPEGEPLSEATHDASRFRQAFSALLSQTIQIFAQIKTLVRVEEDIWDGIWETVIQDGIDLLLLGWSSDSLLKTVGDGMLDRRLAAPPCDVIAVRPANPVTGPGGWQIVKNILLPLRGGPYAGLALRVANALAQTTDATITLLHATDQAPRQAEQQLLTAFGPVLRGLKRLKRATTVVVENVSEAIIQEAPGHQVIVMGAPSTKVHPEGWSGPLLDDIFAGSNVTVIIVKQKSPITPGEAQQVQGELPPQEQEDIEFASIPAEEARQDRPVAVLVDEWFAENTYHSREFADLQRLIALKQSQGLTISLGLPALNEAGTVGKVITTLKTALIDEAPLLDEMVLIDSGSVDYTREIACDLGIPVYLHQEVLPQYGAYTGKGEALWKSLYILKGDIIAWVDTDINNIHPRFVYGILGPLLKNPSIQYVKGFYRRPLREGDKLIAGGGGRVTELTARPFINLFFPELSGILQPLSGEYAGRRQALERMPFFTGYGVETGLLLDILDEFGLSAIAQVDLQERIHHNQPLPSLSKMSFAIMQVVFSRLEKRHKVRLLEEANLTMNLVRYGTRRFYLETEEIRERERPPMIRLPEYRADHGLESLSSNQFQANPNRGPVIPKEGS